MRAIPAAVRGPVRVGGLLAILMAVAIVIVGCGSKEAEAPAKPAATATAAVVTQASWAPDALEELLAPIALYPDPLLGQILAASVNPQEVLDGGNWLLQNQNLTGDALSDAAQKAGFGPAMLALVQFPTVVDMMCQQIDWTKQLGSAFTSDQAGVLDAVQRLRTNALNVGNLKTTPQQQVSSTTEQGKTVVVVKPADPEIIYVPQYDPQVVYTTPPPSGPSTGEVLLAFGVGIAVGAAMSNACYPHWGAGCVYVGPRPFYPPAYVYRPVYGPAFHPAYRYAPPAGYRYGYNHQTNVIINNNNYYNRFDHNTNLHGGGTRSPLATNQPAHRNVGASQASWKGQTSYAGARNAGTTARAGTSASGPSATQGHVGGSSGTKASRSQHIDRGYGGSSPGTSGRASAQASRSASGASTPRHDDALSGASRGGSNSPGGESRASTTPQKDNAFSGASQAGSGSFDRASSARGRASTSGSSSSRTGGGGGGRRRG